MSHLFQLHRSTQVQDIVNYHRYKPAFALSSGLRMWIKLTMSESHLLDGTTHTDFNVEVWTWFYYARCLIIAFTSAFPLVFPVQRGEVL